MNTQILATITSFLPSVPVVLMAVGTITALVHSTALSEAQKDAQVASMLVSAINGIQFAGPFAAIEKDGAMLFAPILAKLLVTEAEHFLPQS